MLVNLDEVLKPAQKQGYAVGAFNVYSLETIEAVYGAAEELKMPVIIAFGETYAPIANINLIGASVKEIAKDSKMPIALHLDHCKSKELIIKALQVGFTSVMFDGSELSFEENMKQTKEIVDIAHSVDATVEAELGYIPGEDTGEGIQIDQLTRTDEAVEFVKNTGCDALAIAVGTIHGNYTGEPKIYHERLKEIAAAVDVPLVLHGGSGNTESDIKLAIDEGVSKINVNTAISNAAVDKIKQLYKNEELGHLSQIMKLITPPMKEAVKNHMKLFSRGKLEK
jgi:fructose-bisphosphate aldolase class II